VEEGRALPQAAEGQDRRPFGASVGRMTEKHRQLLPGCGTRVPILITGHRLAERD
jgi:hypothetical protein